MPSQRAKCGTDSGYRRHLARGETTCGECRAAHTEANKRRGKKRITANCGTDAGYYRHHRVLKEPACDKCKVAHAAAQRRYSSGRKSVRRHCPCGVALRTTLTHCSRCRRKGLDEEPVAWVRQGPILVAVYEQKAEVA